MWVWTWYIWVFRGVRYFIMVDIIIIIVSGGSIINRRITVITKCIPPVFYLISKDGVLIDFFVYKIINICTLKKKLYPSHRMPAYNTINRFTSPAGLVLFLKQTLYSQTMCCHMWTGRKDGAWVSSRLLIQTDPYILQLWERCTNTLKPHYLTPQH